MSEPLNPYQLARMADVTSPDEMDSPGAVWLLSVARSATEIIEDTNDDRDIQDRISEAADGSVPIYTHEKWQVFIDVCAYHEDVTAEFGTPEDWGQASNWALYMIAERLLSALIEEAGSDDDDDD